MSMVRTAARRQFANRILTTAYEENLKNRAIAGELPPAVEVLLLHYKLGKPTEEVEHVSSGNDLMDASNEELLAAARAIEARLAAQVASEPTPPPEDTGSVPPAGSTPMPGGGSVH